MSMHTLQFKTGIDAIVATGPQQKRDMLNVEYHVMELLENTVVDQETKPVGL